jgi:hypothetical protein
MKKLLIILAFLPLIGWGQIDIRQMRGGIVSFQGGEKVLYNQSAQELFNRMTVQPSADEKSVYSRMFDRLQASSIQDSLDAMWLTSVHDQQAANLNIFNNNHTLTNNGASWMAYFGYTGNGTSAYLNTNYNPTQDGINYELNSASFGFALDSLTTGVSQGFGVSDGIVHTFIYPSVSNVTSTRLNSGTNTNVSNTDIEHIFTINRLSSSTQQIYIDDVFFNGNVTSTNMPNLDVYLLAINDDGVSTVHSDNNLNSAFIGGQLNAAQIDSLVDIINDFNEDIRALAPIAWGISPSFAPRINSQNLQANLNGGDVKKIITPAGTYGLDTTIWLESDTELSGVDGVILQKEATYSNVFLNRGATTKTFNENITLNNLELSVNGYEQTWEHVYGQRAQVGFFFIKNLTITNFTCTDIGTLQFGIYIGKWQDVYYENLRIEGQKDAIDFKDGHGALVRNCTFKTKDDAVFMGGSGGFPSTMMESIGDVYDLTFKNVRYVDSSKIYPARNYFIYVNSWADWQNGNTYENGHFSVNASKIYQCANGSGFSAVAANAPTHNNGTITAADGIAWHYIDTGNVYKTDAYDITIDSCFAYDPSAFIYCPVSDIAEAHTIYPGTEDSASAYNITVSNCTISNTTAVDMQVGLKDVAFTDNYYDSLSFYVRSFQPVDSDSLYIVSNGNDFNNSNNFFTSINNKRLFIDSRNETFLNSTFVNNPTGTGEVRAINYDLPFTDKSKITPVLNDTCRFTDGLNYWNGSSWELIP